MVSSVRAVLLFLDLTGVNPSSDGVGLLVARVSHIKSPPRIPVTDIALYS